MVTPEDQDSLDRLSKSLEREKRRGQMMTRMQDLQSINVRLRAQLTDQEEELKGLRKQLEDCHGSKAAGEYAELGAEHSGRIVALEELNMLVKQKADSENKLQMASNDLLLCRSHRRALYEELRMKTRQAAELQVNLEILRRSGASAATGEVYDRGDEPLSQAELETFTAQVNQASQDIEKHQRARGTLHNQVNRLSLGPQDTSDEATRLTRESDSFRTQMEKEKKQRREAERALCEANKRHEGEGRNFQGLGNVYDKDRNWEQLQHESDDCQREQQKLKDDLKAIQGVLGANGFGDPVTNINNRIIELLHASTQQTGEPQGEA